MPLSMAEQGKTVTIMRVTGQEETRLFLEKLGFVPGAEVSVISESGGSLIVEVKGSRVAVGKELAMKVFVG